MELSDIIAGVVAGLTTTGDRRNWNGRGGLVGVDGGVSAVSEDDTIATIVIGYILFECGYIEAVVFSGITHSLSHLLRLASTARLAAGVTLLIAAVTALNGSAR